VKAFTKEDEEMAKYYRNKENIIFDRAFYGQFIYQTSGERQERRWLSLNELYQLEELVNLNKIPVVLVSAKPEVVTYLCSLDKNDSYYSEDIPQFSAGGIRKFLYCEGAFVP